MKLYLSSEVLERMVNEIDYGAAESVREAEELARIEADIRWANDHRDARGLLDISRECFDWIMAELDWIAASYYDDMGGNGNG